MGGWNQNIFNFFIIMKTITAQKKLHSFASPVSFSISSGVSQRNVLKNNKAVQKVVLTNNTVNVLKCKFAYIIQQCLAEYTSDFN